MDKWEVNIKFEADPKWKPLDTACWFHCPLACLTPLKEVCNAKKAYDNDRIVICPILRFGERIK